MVSASDSSLEGYGVSVLLGSLVAAGWRGAASEKKRQQQRGNMP